MKLLQREGHEEYGVEDRDTWTVLYIATHIWEGGASAETALMGAVLRYPYSVLAFSFPAPGL